MLLSILVDTIVYTSPCCSVYFSMLLCIIVILIEIMFQMSIINLGKFYNWADNKIIPILETLNEETFTKTLEGTQKSIRDLVEHFVVFYEFFSLRKEKISFRDLQEKI